MFKAIKEVREELKKGLDQGDLPQSYAKAIGLMARAILETFSGALSQSCRPKHRPSRRQRNRDRSQS